MSYVPDELDRRIIAATQAGLPLCAEPYRAIAEDVGCDAEEVMARMTRMLEAGAIRRIGAVPNHYKLGYTANGMTVWDVADEDIRAAGREIGDFDFVSHCYHRPRHLPHWPYNLFAMVHGKSHEEVAGKAERIAAALGSRCRGHQILLSTKILKKTGLRLAA
jgi:DNA-binding Lrp family transcriptional regulator